MKQLIITILCCAPFLVSGQTNYWQGGLFVGGSALSSDVNPHATPDFTESSLALGLSGRVNLSPRLGMRVSLSYAGLTGDDANYAIRADRGFRFDTRLIELAAVAEWEPFASNRYYTNARGRIEMDRIVSPYLFAGLGLGLAQLDTDFSRYVGNDPLIEEGIRADRSMGSTQNALIVPVGAGMKFDITSYVTIALELGGRICFSDYLDGISAAAGPNSDDVYFVGGLHLYYRFVN